MSNQRSTGNKNNKRKAPARPKKRKYADDRTPTVKKIDRVCKVLAFVLAALLIANVHVLVGGGGYDDTEIVPVLGIADSKVETDIMEPEIKAKSAVFIKTNANYEVGDIVQYFDGEYNPVRRIIDISEDEEIYTVLGDNEPSSDAVEIKAEDLRGKVFLSSKALYGFMKVYHTTLGAAITMVISMLLIVMGDILMFKKRKAALKEKREAQARKEARKLKVKQGIEEAGAAEEENPIEKRRAEKEAKLEKERAEIAAEMKEIQKKMKAEEQELKQRKRGKK